MNNIYVAESKDIGDDQWKINFMNELIEAKGISCFFSKLLIFLVGIYFIIVVFVFFLIRNCMLYATFLVCYVHT